MRREISELNDSWGRFVENRVAPACETLFLRRVIPVHRVSQRLKNRVEGETMEIDVFVANQDHVLVVEVKSRLTFRKDSKSNSASPNASGRSDLKTLTFSFTRFGKEPKRLFSWR